VPGSTGPSETRPWGSFEVLGCGDGYQVKRLIVQPGKRLSLQWHTHRDEVWTVVRGTALVNIGSTQSTLSGGQSTRVARKVQHRIANPSEAEPLEIIEVQLGAYLGEDDIVRVEDDHGRS
jgi:mannose-1-phosphate guanylyltransferase/mannose-6-phosphate isomerase